MLKRFLICSMLMFSGSCFAQTVSTAPAQKTVPTTAVTGVKTQLAVPAVTTAKPLATTPISSVTKTSGQSTPTQPQAPNASFENCSKVYGTSVENLFYLTLAAISASNYSLDEVQSRTGLILFNAGNKELLASITAVGNSQSMIRITPVNNSYSFSMTIVERIFNYLNNNIK